MGSPRSAAKDMFEGTTGRSDRLGHDFGVGDAPRAEFSSVVFQANFLPTRFGVADEVQCFQRLACRCSPTSVVTMFYMVVERAKGLGYFFMKPLVTRAVPVS